jgi:hypothetical protein
MDVLSINALLILNERYILMPVLQTSSANGGLSDGSAGVDDWREVMRSGPLYLSISVAGCAAAAVSLRYRDLVRSRRRLYAAEDDIGRPGARLLEAVLNQSGLLLAWERSSRYLIPRTQRRPWLG